MPVQPVRSARFPIRHATVLALFLAGCSGGGPGGGGFQMPPAPVEVVDVRPRTVRDQFHALGSIESNDRIEVVSELDAIVRSLPFTEGQSVARGALLAQLNDTEIKAEADRAGALHEKAKADFERAQALFQQNAIPQQALDDARTALRVAEATAAINRARLAKTRIRAPFSGLVGRRRVSPGAYLRTGEVITELARVDEMKVSFAAPERFARTLRSGVAVEVTTPALPTERFSGRVSVVDPIINPDTRTVGLVARIPNPSGRLRPGMSANVSVTLSQRTGALSVPDEAVFAEGAQSFVFLVKADSSVARTPITLGTRDSAWVEVLHGLEGGAVVVRAGHHKLYDGAKVVPIRDAGAAGAAAAAGGASR